MGQITVLTPDYEEAPPETASFAPRSVPTEPVTITLIDNSKPNAQELLRRIADRLSDRIPVADIEVHSKPSAAKPIDADVAEMLAARSHMVVVGLGD